jgi:hypothetical protein
MANCLYCGQNNYGVGIETGMCVNCKDDYFWTDVEFGARWLSQGHTIACVFGMLDMKLCICGVKNGKNKIKGINDTESLK